MGADIEILVDEERLRPESSEVQRLFASNQKAVDLFNWRPLYGGKDGFQRGLRETIDWFLMTENLSCYKTDIYNI
jgi:nucleoside-diphosphate-sugar epimerase